MMEGRTIKKSKSKINRCKPGFDGGWDHLFVLLGTVFVASWFPQYKKNLA
jgi:hypothetical protein